MVRWRGSKKVPEPSTVIDLAHAFYHTDKLSPKPSSFLNLNTLTLCTFVPDELTLAYPHALPLTNHDPPTPLSPARPSSRHYCIVEGLGDVYRRHFTEQSQGTFCRPARPHARFFTLHPLIWSSFSLLLFIHLLISILFGTRTK